MNYRHGFHAGNFADVFKHAVLARVLDYLRAKPAPIRVIDAHAGAGRYDLRGEEAARTGEWREGIARLLAASLDRRTQELLEPYLACVRSLNDGDEIRTYPGSPLITRSLLRPSDRLMLHEIEPSAADALARAMGRDAQTKIVPRDGWAALQSLPPPERRGMVLLDPPYEDGQDFERILDALRTLQRRWPTGLCVVWYPIKSTVQLQTFVQALPGTGVTKLLRAEIELAPPRAAGALTACGVLVVNPPWTLEAELRELMPSLVRALAPAGRGRSRIVPG